MAKVPKEYLESGSEKGVNYEYKPSWQGMFVAKQVYSCSVSYRLPEACRVLYKKIVESRDAMRRCLQQTTKAFQVATSEPSVESKVNPPNDRTLQNIY